MVSLASLAVFVAVYVLVVSGGYRVLQPRLREHVTQSVLRRFGIGYAVATTVLGVSLTLGLITLVPSGLEGMDGGSIPSPDRIPLIVAGTMLGAFLLLGAAMWTVFQITPTDSEVQV